MLAWACQAPYPTLSYPAPDPDFRRLHRLCFKADTRNETHVRPLSYSSTAIRGLSKRLYLMLVCALLALLHRVGTFSFSSVTVYMRLCISLQCISFC